MVQFRLQMASHTTEDGFHEIQLNGKQLVFLFMAATVVSVVIFLCGVLVGRGVRAERTVAQVAALNDAPAPDILPSAPAAAPPAIQAGADPRDAAPPAPVDEKSSAVTEDILPDSAKAAKAPPVPAEKPAPAPTVAKPEKSDEARKILKRSSGLRSLLRNRHRPPSRLPNRSPLHPRPRSPRRQRARPAVPARATPGDGYAVQVAAVNGRPTPTRSPGASARRATPRMSNSRPTEPARCSGCESAPSERSAKRRQ